MRKFSFLSKLTRRLSSFRDDQRGISAVEFAMLLPLMITLYFGVEEVTHGVAAQRKVTLTARTIADIASQFTSINNAQMANILEASKAVIDPYKPQELKVTVSAVSVDADGVAKVVWSEGTETRSPGSTVTLPAALNTPNTQLIWSEVKYHYVPTVGSVITGPIDLFDEIYMRPRLSETVNRINS
jgi:Flp pilus assembly protein TadG